MEQLIELEKIDTSILQILLKDRTTGKNITWATDSYSHLGPAYERDKQIFIDQIWNTGIIEPRIQKALEVQKERTKKNAEVFTPAWICNQMNNQIEIDWLSSDSTFNTGTSNSWKTCKEQIRFRTKNGWKSYIRRRVLEITCGEAPFLVSRYDSSTGETIPVGERIGLLDRKLRIAAENTKSAEEWYSWVLSGLRRTYGYEFQGDSLLLGRINAFLTVVEAMNAFWSKYPDLGQQKEIATIISWNLFQMDGLTACTPIGVPEDRYIQPTLFDFFEESQDDNKTAAPVTIDWWDKGKRFHLRDMKEGKIMSKKFDVVIGNPPYQLNDGGGGAGKSASPIYDKFMEEAKKLTPKVIELITPSRWMNGGKGLDKFRETMLNDDRIKYIVDYANSRNCFPGVDIPGGISYFIWNSEYHGPCQVDYIGNNGSRNTGVRFLNETKNYIRNNDVVNIVHKISKQAPQTMNSVVSSRKPFGLESKELSDGSKELLLRNSKGLGSIKRAKIKSGFNLIDKWKVIVSKVTVEHGGIPDKDGRMKVLSIVETIPPQSVSTETYLIAGSFNSQSEAQNLEKYLKTKFVRFLLSQSLASMNMSKSTYSLVPVQNYTSESDIDWSGSIASVDQQLYSKYGLEKGEINSIENMIKEME